MKRCNGLLIARVLNKGGAPSAHLDRGSGWDRYSQPESFFMLLPIAFFADVRQNEFVATTLTFEELVGMLVEAAEEPRDRSAKKECTSFIPATFHTPRRAKANITARHAFALDVDGDGDGHLQFAEMVALLDDLRLQHITHTTTKSTHAVNRYRVILPCEAISVPEYEGACRSIDQALSGGRGLFDSGCYDASRLNLFPQRWHGIPEDAPDFDASDGHHAIHARLTGELIDVKAIVEAFPPPPPEESTWHEIAPAEAKAILANRPLTHVHDYDKLTDLDDSPLVTDKMRDDYLIG